MNSDQDKENLHLENVWGKDLGDLEGDVRGIWQQHGGPMGNAATERLRQVVFLVRNPEGQVVGLSTAFKVHVKQLRNHFYALRLLLTPGYRIPGLTSKLLVSTRDFLESIHARDSSDPAIGIITLVENPRLKAHRNEAIWPASGMVYIGNSGEGHHIRVYYFKGAHIAP